MGFVIWGAGVRGKKLLDLFGDEFILAFIDSNKSLINEVYCGKLVIDFATYRRDYKEEIILVSAGRELSILQELRDNEVKQYLLVNDFINFDIICDINNRRKLKTYIEKKAQLFKVAIYGISIFSILVYDWLLEHGNSVCLVKERDCEENVQAVVEYLRKQGYKVVENQGELPTGTAVIFNAIGEMDEIENELQVIDITDLTEVFPEHKNPELKQFKGLYKNKRCFIVATGPSLRINDLDCLLRHGEVCISMNKIFYGFDETDWRPDYYIVSDKRISQPCKSEILSFEAKAKFINDYDEEFWKDCSQEKVYKYHHYGNNNRHGLFSEDISKYFRDAGSVTFMAFQLAAYMGFSEIYLLGVDHSFGTEVNAPERHFYGNKDTKAFKLQMVPEDLLYVERCYKSAEKYSRTHGFRIYNATRGGNLEIFERKNFDELFQDN